MYKKTARFKEAPFNLATLYFRLGDREKALEYFNLVLEKFPDLERQVVPYLKMMK